MAVGIASDDRPASTDLGAATVLVADVAGTRAFCACAAVAECSETGHLPWFAAE